MEVDKEQHEDIPNYNIEDELDDGNQEYDLETEDGENKDIHYNCQSDSEKEIHKTIPTRSNKKRGVTRFPKLKTEYVNYGAKKHVRFDEFGKFTRKNIALFVSYLGDLICEKMEHEKQIKEGQVNVELGTDVMTLVFGKEKSGFLKGVGTGVTYNKYFNVRRSKGSSNDEIKDLKVAMHNGKLELDKKDVELKALSTKVNEQDQTLKLVLAHLNAKEADFPNLSHTI
ncbi:unnamed protein product [Lactuca saligna]|uniref:Uncharacterized protein n=1 Tax=Lactuca saligna TaxID=75948 RepID=A0AA35YEC9_LACSI|nr:unnamed protein product [Lactuca saligna]